MTSMPSTGERIRQRRVALGWSQGELAERAGTQQSRISRIERGSLPGVALAHALAAALDVEVDQLFDLDRAAS